MSSLWKSAAFSSIFEVLLHTYVRISCVCTHAVHVYVCTYVRIRMHMWRVCVPLKIKAPLLNSVMDNLLHVFFRPSLCIVCVVVARQASLEKVCKVP